MPEQHIRIPMANGAQADAFLFTPENNDSASSFPAILDYPDIKGVREASREMSQRVANEGYLVLSPNVFYRFGPPPVFDDVPWDFSNPATKQRFGELTSPLVGEAFAADARAYASALDSNGAAPGPIGVIGHCFTGGLALRTAAALPDRIGVAVSFHGGGLYQADNPNSPHREIPKIKASLYFGHAKDDGSMPSEAIAKLEEDLKSWGGLYDSEVYGAHHGWTVLDNPAYDQPEAERAHRKLVSLLASLRS
jgi:carboxymethylenebutenolidase